VVELNNASVLLRPVAYDLMIVESTLLTELRDLLTETIKTARRVTDAHGAWERPAAHSQAGQELTLEEARRPEPLTGSWPWLLAPMIAKLALEDALEEAMGFSALLGHETSYAADVLCRAVLETSSLAWWLLEPDIDSKTRLARSLSYRLLSAEHRMKAIGALDLAPDEVPSEYGEVPEDVMKDITSAQLPVDERGKVKFSGEEARPGYTQRVASLVVKIWPQQKVPYAQLSAVAHGEMLGLERNLAQGEPRLRVAPADDDVWPWQDTYLVVGALIFTAHRAAGFLDLRDQAAALYAWMEEGQQRLLAVRPSSENTSETPSREAHS
jgi:hypothetical protein